MRHKHKRWEGGRERKRGRGMKRVWECEAHLPHLKSPKKRYSKHCHFPPPPFQLVVKKATRTINTSPPQPPNITCTCIHVVYLHRHQRDRGFGLGRRDKSQGILQAAAHRRKQSKTTRAQVTVAAVPRRLRPRSASTVYMSIYTQYRHIYT